MTAAATWYFDFISPFAYLQLARMRTINARTPIVPRPIVFAAVLGHHGQLGPAEIPGKREFTYHMVQWLADSSGVALRFPPAHPFNPLQALRLAVACGSTWDGVTRIFEHIWKQGAAADTSDALRELARELGIADVAGALSTPLVKEQLRANTDEAIAHGVFGVPTVRLGTRLFWGCDATPMVEAAIADADVFSRGEYARLAALPRAAERAR